VSRRFQRSAQGGIGVVDDPDGGACDRRYCQRLRRLSALVLAGLTLQTAAAHAQVLEIGGDGAVKVYSGPAVVTDAGSTPIRSTPPKATRSDRQAYRRALGLAAAAAELSPELVGAVAWRESGGRSGRVSSKGAVGVMQLMPATARELGVDPADEQAGLRGGAAYLNRLMARYDGDLVRALAAYNAGPGAVDRYHGVPPYKETQAYVAAVLDRLSELAAPTAATKAMR
jgi:soluble lytic murein transglycosylase-like protein